MPWEHIQQQLHGLYEDKSPTFFALLESLHYLESIDQILHEQLHEDSPNLSDALRLLSRLVVKKDTNTEDDAIREDSSEESLNESHTSQENTLLADKIIGNELDAISDEQHIITSEHHNSLPSKKKHVPISINNRKEAILAIKKATLWFIENEPSSPVIILLNQAEKMIGKKFSEVFQSIPEELVYQWSKESDENTL
jgi:type VI secretion system protein ImpA